MFILYAAKNRLTVRRKEPVTSGSVNAYTAQFTFSGEWEGLARRAVFRTGEKRVSMPLDQDGACAIPWEVLTDPGRLEAGVYGTRGGETVLPTVWADLGYIQPGAAPGGEAQLPPSGSGGVTDHRELTGREAAKQHPIAAIDGLEAELERIPAPAEPLTNEELEEIFK